MSIKVHAVDHPDLPPHPMPDRFRVDVIHFTLPQSPDQPRNEYRLDGEQLKTIYEDGVFRVVSPLDSATRAEIEITEEQEGWLEWILQHNVRHIRLG